MKHSMSNKFSTNKSFSHGYFSSFLSFKCIFLMFVCVYNCQLVQAENALGCLIDDSVCEPYEFCYSDFDVGGVCLSSRELSIDGNDDDQIESTSPNQSDGLEYDMTDDENDGDDEDQRGPIFQSLRSEEATPLYLANQPIRVHKYNFQNNHENDKIDDFVSYIESMSGDDDEDESENEQDSLDKSDQSWSSIWNRLFEPNYVNREDESQNSIEYEPENIDTLVRLVDSEQSYDELPPISSNDDDDDDEDDDDEYYSDLLLINDPKRAAELEKFVLIANENGVAPVQPRIYDGDQDSDEQDDDDEDERILERIHHDLTENMLIEKLVNSLQESKESGNEDEIEKRFEKSRFTEPVPSPTVKFLQKDGGLIADEENMNEMIQNENSPDGGSYIFLATYPSLNAHQISFLMDQIAAQTSIPRSSFKNITPNNQIIMFRLENPNRLIGETSEKARIMEYIAKDGTKTLSDKGIKIISFGETRPNLNHKHPFNIDPRSQSFILITIVTCVTLTSLLIVLSVIYFCRRRSLLSSRLLKDVSGGQGGPIYRINFNDDESLIQDKNSEGVFRRAWRRVVEFVKRRGEKYASVSTTVVGTSGTNVEVKEAADYQDLCRQRAKVGAGNKGNVSPTIVNERSESPRSSTSSWSEEPIKTLNIDITTGHTILSYMEEHLNDKHKLQEEWSSLCEYEAEPNKCDMGNLPENMTKNRYSNILPFDHSRVKLKSRDNDYINANYIIDDDPRNPSYIAAQGPLMHTTNDFWQMVWQEESVVIVSLCRTIEYGSAKCYQFWPGNGACVYDKFEIHLVSEHVWCEDYLVRNFFLKNIDENQTRTVTQFHFLTWPENGVPQNIKSFLDFRRKVNKSFKAKSSPLIVHCNDGVGRTGTYLLIDMVLNKISKGAKEIDIAATLEYLRDQRPGMIKHKSQFEYSFAVITEELHNMLKALRQ